MQLNEVNFAGFVGKDAERIDFGSGSFTKFSVCHTEKGKEGKPDKSTWLDVICFGKTGDIAKGIKKGDNVFATGTLSIKDTEKDGKTYRNVSVLARVIAKVAKFDHESAQQTQAPGIDQIPF